MTRNNIYEQRSDIFASYLQNYYNKSIDHTKQLSLTLASASILQVHLLNTEKLASMKVYRLLCFTEKSN